MKKIDYMIEMLAGAYPAEAYKLANKNGETFKMILNTKLQRYDDDTVMKALWNIIDTSDTLPSVAMIVKECRHLANRTPEYKPLPPTPRRSSGSSENDENIQRIIAKIKIKIVQYRNGMKNK